MKKKPASIALLMMATFFLPKHNLVGHWITNGANHSKVNIDFNGNGTFKVSTRDRVENEGLYTFYNDTISITDKNCGEIIQGIYKITFHTDDSASFKVITDPCLERSGEINGGIIIREPAN